MTPDDLRALADAIVYRDSLAIARAADYLRACADALPAPAAPQAMEDANVWKQIVPDDEPQAEPKREALSDGEILDIATAAGLRFSMYSDDVETRAAIKRLARAVERAHKIGGSDAGAD